MKKLIIFLVSFLFILCSNAMAVSPPFNYTIQTEHPRLFINADCTRDDSWENDETYTTGQNIQYQNQIFKARQNVPINQEPTGHDEYWEVCIDFAELRARASRPSSDPAGIWYDAIIDYADREDDCDFTWPGPGQDWAWRYPIAAFANAFAYLMTGEAQYKTDAVACADVLDSNSAGSTNMRTQFTTLLAMAYDWLVDAEDMTGVHGSCTNLTSGQSDTFIGAIEEWGDYWRDNYTSQCVKTCKEQPAKLCAGSLIMGNIALFNDVSGAQWTNLTSNGDWDVGIMTDGIIDCINKVEDGYNWGFYTSQYIPNWGLVLAAAATGFTDFDMTTDAPVGADWTSLLYAVPEFGSEIGGGSGDGMVGWFEFSHANGLPKFFGPHKSVGAFISNDSRLRWWAREAEDQPDNIIDFPYAHSGWSGGTRYTEALLAYPFIFVDNHPNLNTAPSIANSGTAHQNWSQTFMRSGWAYLNDIVVRVNHQTPLDHGCMADGSFEVWRGDDHIIVERGKYVHPGDVWTRCYHRVTISSSGITVWDSGGTEIRSESCSGVPHSGSQVYPDIGNGGHFPDIAADVNVDKDSSRRYMGVASKRFKDASLYDYVYVDTSPSYDDKQATSVTRSFVFLKGDPINETDGYLVIYDRVTSESSADRKRLLFQYQAETHDESGDIVTLTEGVSSIYITPLLPTSPDWTHESGQLVNPYSGESGTTYNNADYGDGRYELMYDSESQYERFFNILQIGPSSASRVTVTLDNTENDLDCAIIDDDVDPWVACFNDDESRIQTGRSSPTIITVALTSGENYNFMVADLTEDDPFEIRKDTVDGQSVAARQVESDGTLTFSYTPTSTGNHTFVVFENDDIVEIGDPAEITDLSAATGDECKEITITRSGGNFNAIDCDDVEDGTQVCNTIQCKYSTSAINNGEFAGAAQCYNGTPPASDTIECKGLPADETTYYVSCIGHNGTNPGGVYNCADSCPNAATPTAASDACDEPLNEHYIHDGTNYRLILGDNITQPAVTNDEFCYDNDQTGVCDGVTGWIDDLHDKGITAAQIWGLTTPTQYADEEDGDPIDKRYGELVDFLQPWSRDMGGCTAFDGDPCFNLIAGTWDEDYFDLVEGMAASAQTNGMYFIICIMDGWVKDSSWAKSPFNSINGGRVVAGSYSMAVGNSVLQFDCTGGPPGCSYIYGDAFNPSWELDQEQRWIMEKLFVKFVTDLSVYDNVIFELMNEAEYADKDDFYGQIVPLVRDTLDGLGRENMIMVNHTTSDFGGESYNPWDDDEVDLISYHEPYHDTNQSVYEHRAFNIQTYQTDYDRLTQDVWDGISSYWSQENTKPVIWSETVKAYEGEPRYVSEISGGHPNRAQLRRVLWANITAGAGMMAQIDSGGWEYDRDFPDTFPGPMRPWSDVGATECSTGNPCDADDLRTYIGTAASYVTNNVGVEYMVPDDDLVSADAVALIYPCNEYLIYRPDTTTFTLDLSSCADDVTFNVYGLNPRVALGPSNPETLNTVDGGGSWSPPASTDDYVYHLTVDTPAVPPDVITTLVLSTSETLGGWIEYEFRVPGGVGDPDYCEVAYATTVTGRIDSDEKFNTAVAAGNFIPITAELTADELYENQFEAIGGALAENYASARCKYSASDPASVNTNPGQVTGVTIGDTLCGGSSCNYADRLEDTFIDTDNQTFNYGGYIFDNWGNSRARRGLFKIDFIPPIEAEGLESSDYADIISANLHLFSQAESGAGSKTYTAHRLLKAWGEGVQDGSVGAENESTWLDAMRFSVPFASGGASTTADANDSDNWNTIYDRGSATDGTVAIDSVSAWATMDVTTAVQQMFEDTLNNGFLIITTTEGGTSRAFTAAGEDNSAYMMVSLDMKTDLAAASDVLIDPAGCEPSDVVGLTCTTKGAGEIEISFTAPYDQAKTADDCSVDQGTVHDYIVRYRTDTAVVNGNWDSSTEYEQVGLENVTNGDFDDWTTDDPDGWTVTGEDANAEVSEVGSDEAHGGSGTNSANIWTDDGGYIDVTCSGCMTVGYYYTTTFDITTSTTGAIKGGSATGGVADAFIDVSDVGSYSYTFEALHGNFAIARNSGNTDITIDNVTLKPASCTADTTVWRPQGPGTTETRSLCGLMKNTLYHLSIKGGDEEENVSENVATSVECWTGPCVKHPCGSVGGSNPRKGFGCLGTD